jgi:hypothetical protein
MICNFASFFLETAVLLGFAQKRFKCLQKSYRNISMWDLVLKSLLRETSWCNWILITIFGFRCYDFFSISKEISSGEINGA